MWGEEKEWEEALLAATSTGDYGLVTAKQDLQFLCLNFYAFTLLFSPLVAKKTHMHFPKLRLTESGITVLMP